MLVSVQAWMLAYYLLEYKAIDIAASQKKGQRSWNLRFRVWLAIDFSLRKRILRFVINRQVVYGMHKIFKQQTYTFVKATLQFVKSVTFHFFWVMDSLLEIFF